MIRLVSTNDKLQMVLGGAVTANQLQAVVNFSERSAADYVGGCTRTNSNNTTDVDICAAPASGNYRDIDGINVYNRDTAQATVYIKIDVSGTEHILGTFALNPGDTLSWLRGCGWQVTDNAGRLKTVGSGGSGASDDLSYTHTQGSASTTWTMNHNLGKFPSTEVVDSGGNRMIPFVNHIDANSLTVTFGNATSGKVYCN